MKFEDYLIEKSQEQLKRRDLEKEVIQLQAELKSEEALNRVLRCALDCPVFSLPFLPSLFPPHVHWILQVQVLLEELAVVEEEIFLLERKVNELKLLLYTEREQSREWGIHFRRTYKHNKLPRVSSGYGSHNFQVFTKGRLTKNKRASLSCALDIDIHGLFSTPRTSNEFEVPRSSTGKIPRQSQMQVEIGNEKPNEVSEELLKCLIGIFLELNQPSLDREDYSESVPKLSLSCMKSDIDGSARDVGPYKDFIQITTTSLDIDRFSQCLPAFGKLRLLMNKLRDVDLNFLSYKQKLAFWINIYNACIMNAFLDYGLPCRKDKQLALMNKAAINVGGIVLNALAIEHFILRHPCHSKHGCVDEKEMVIRHAYGLGYPEPNVTFGLCRGTWSSPALRVYTSDEVVNELGRAKVEYLEAAVGVTSKRKIIVPKLLQRHMQDFADDMESLLEWIYSQLPRSGSASFKRAIMECLLRETKSPISKMLEIQPYQSHFRYLLPL
ncbi:Ternary complex factor MIP1 [Senna tora]|uniref:Ternary complex factor MIP1 n=1 Tax=Senna tora TaxID=362788 RepID=A0A834T957_9FABA|nr:Ternary complex factor MIP1 [Senna tora]